MRLRAAYLLICLVVASERPAGAQGVTEHQNPVGTAEDDANRRWIALAERWFGSSDDDTPPAFSVVFGGIKPGSGPAVGPAVAYTFSNGSLVQARAEYSIHSYKLLQAQYRSRAYGALNAVVSSRVRWQDAPSVALYELGPDSSDGRALYVERKTEYSGEVMLRPTGFTRVAGGFGYERFRLDDGRTDPREDEHLDVVPPLPGLGARRGFLHSFAAAGVDTRRAGDISRSGSRVNIALHRFDDRDGGTYSFSQFIAEGEHWLPVSEDRGTLALVGNLWASNGTTVPFFLMPTLGGGEFLRGYRLYRFRDRDAMVLTAQFHWRLQEFVDGVAFVDGGRVAPRLSSLHLGGFRPTGGVGLRVRTAKKTIFRLDVAHSVEGFQFLVGFSSRPSAVF